MHQVFLSLGSNLGNRQKYLETARIFLSNFGEIKKESSIFETKAWGKTDQPDFLNRILFLETNLPPQELLQECQKIENKLGRERKEKWDSRTIDIDLLFYDNLIVSAKNLQIPHPYIPEREFVLVPLNEIAPDFVHPFLKKTINELCQDLKCSEALISNYTKQD